MTLDASPPLVGAAAMERRASDVIRDDHGVLHGDRFGEIAREMIRWSETWTTAPPGDRWDVALVTPQTGEALAAVTGLAVAGWAVGVVDPGWTPAEQQAAVHQLDPSAVVVPADQGVTGQRLVVAGWRPVMHPNGAWIALLPPGREGGCVPPAPTPDTAFYVGFTSGSTGRPKAFARSHRSWRESFRGLDELVRITERDLVAIPGSVSSSHFLFGALHALDHGADLDLRTVPGTRPWAGAPAPDVVYVVPSLLTRMLDSCDGRERSPRYLMCAGARLEPEVIGRASWTWPNAGLVEYYGASELSFVTIRCPGDGAPVESVGRAFPGVEVTVRDDDDRPVAPGVTGRVFARGPLTFSGYRGAVPVSAARRADDGAWTVGDSGHLDENGYLYVAGRGSALIITGGMNVQPEEVEGVLAAAPGVHEAVVVGVPDAQWGEIVVAVLTTGTGVDLRREDLRSLVAERLAAGKRPRRYLAHSAPLPLLPSGKADRIAIRESVLEGVLDEIR